MESGTECPYCHENAVIDDQHGCEQLKVCEACGAVISDAQTFSDPIESEGRVNINNQFANIPWNMRRNFQVSKAGGTKSGIEIIELIKSKFKLTSVEHSMTTELFEKAVSLPVFKFTKIEKKEALAASCAYITLRQKNYPVTKKIICDYVSVPLEVFSDMFTQIVTLLNITITSTAIEDILPEYFSECRLQDKQQVEAKTLKIMLLAKKVWLTCSKKPQAVVSACAYVAWISLDILNRIDVKYYKFCTMYNFQKYSSSIHRIKEIFDMIKKLVEQLPWVDKLKLKNRRYLLSSLDTILNTSNLLCHLAVGSKDEKEIRDTFVPPRPKKLKHDEQNYPELPTGSVSESPDLTADDIPDESLHYYIRSEKELEDLKLFRKTLNLK